MELTTILPKIVNNNVLHARLLNTLSLMENTGARKISACEDPVFVTQIILKHAAEEHRHAFFLKKQIDKTNQVLPTYAPEQLLAPAYSKYYLNSLDIAVSRYLKNELNLSGGQLRFGAYLLVTYAIEVRADELYPIYQKALDESKSKVNVKSIIVEEEGHLEEMLKQLKDTWPDWQRHADKAVEIETRLFNDWVVALSNEIAN